MKKKFKIWQIVLGVCSLLLITGCGKSSNVESMTCTRTMNQNEIKTSLKYNVQYEGDYVSKIKTIETIETDNVDTLNTYKEQIESLYSPYKDVEYYKYDVDINDNKLTSTVDINYKKVDTDKLLEIDSANGQLIKDGKIRVDDIKSVYESLGATCKND